jgi:hypothetical protein
MDGLFFDEHLPPADAGGYEAHSRRDAVYAEKKARRQARQQPQQQQQQEHTHFSADRAGGHPRKFGGAPPVPAHGHEGFQLPRVKAPYAVHDLPPAGRRAAPGRVFGGGREGDHALLAGGAQPERWGSPRGERARRIERQQQWPRLADGDFERREREKAAAGAAAQAQRAAEQARKIRAGRESFGWVHQGRASEEINFSHAHRQLMMGDGNFLPPISLRGAKQEMDAHHARRQREHRAPWE